MNIIKPTTELAIAATKSPLFVKCSGYIAPYIKPLADFAASNPMVRQFITNLRPHPLMMQIVAIYFIYKWLDQGVADILALETCRHGTNPLSWVGIHAIGGHPNFGAIAIGSTTNWVNDDTRFKFYFFKDDQHVITKRTLPGRHKYFSTSNLVKSLFPKDLKDCKATNIFSNIVGILGLCVPTIKFRFTPSWLNRKAESDLNYIGNGAYYTYYRVANTHIGLFGSLIQGINLDFFHRSYQKPQKLIFGIAQIAIAIALTQASIPSLVGFYVLQEIVLPLIIRGAFKVAPGDLFETY